jgi:hypothetical protein
MDYCVNLLSGFPWSTLGLDRVSSSPLLASLLASLLPSLDSLFSTQGIMVGLLVAYAGAMWMFLNSAPKVYTMMVSDLAMARDLYEGVLNLPAADVPLHYYYNYEQSMGTGGLESFGAMTPSMGGSMGGSGVRQADGLWYQLKKNTQLHVIGGASPGQKDRQRHVCFDRTCLETLLMRVETRGIKHKIRRDRPLNFLVKDFEGRVIELVEVSN